MVLNGDLRLLYLTRNFLQFKQTVQTLIRRRVLWRLIWVCTVCQCQVQVLPSLHGTLTLQPQEKRAINNRYLDFVQMRCLISLVNNNHVDKTKGIFMHVYLGSIVNNRQKKKKKNCSQTSYQSDINIIFTVCLTSLIAPTHLGDVRDQISKNGYTRYHTYI